MGVYSRVGDIMRYAVTLSYDGSSFCGWQTQNKGNSVQEAVEGAIEKLFGTVSRVTGSGRTDAGVHAIKQTAHFDSDKQLSLDAVQGGLNFYLPPTVRVTGAYNVNEDFNARKSAKKKTYIYLMYESRIELPLLLGRAWRIMPNINVEVMNDAAQSFVGRHDFSSFCASGSSAKTFTRTVFKSTVTRDKGFVVFSVTADGFLYHMVRIMAAQLIKAATVGVDIEAVIAAKSRDSAKELAPADGLYLYDVDYGELLCTSNS